MKRLIKSGRHRWNMNSVRGNKMKFNFKYYLSTIEAEIEEREKIEIIKKFLSLLTVREERILRAKFKVLAYPNRWDSFDDEKTNRELARDFNVSSTRIGHLVASGFEKNRFLFRKEKIE